MLRYVLKEYRYDINISTSTFLGFLSSPGKRTFLIRRSEYSVTFLSHVNLLPSTLSAYECTREKMKYKPIPVISAMEQLHSDAFDFDFVYFIIRELLLVDAAPYEYILISRSQKQVQFVLSFVLLIFVKKHAIFFF